MKCPGFRFAVFLLALCLHTSGFSSGVLPDDHGNELSTATVLPAGSPFVGEFEYDTDVDVFAFSLPAWASYTITVDPVTSLGVEIRVIPPNGQGVVWEADTIWTPSAEVADAYHEGASSQWYLQITPLHDFTTGTYQITISEVPGQDTDADGFPDAWEVEVFGDLATADPATDTEAYTTGRDPGDPLAVDRVLPSASGDVLEWAAAPYATYDVFRSVTLLGVDPWEFVGTYVRAGTEGTVQWSFPPSTDPVRFYHIRFREE